MKKLALLTSILVITASVALAGGVKPSDAQRLKACNNIKDPEVNAMCIREVGRDYRRPPPRAEERPLPPGLVNDLLLGNVVGGGPPQNVEQLQKEIELLQREKELLERERNLLQQEQQLQIATSSLLASLRR